MEKALFQEFEAVSAKQWKQKIQFDLKGADYNEKLIFKSRDGIAIKPFYTAEDIGEAVHLESPAQWNICEKIYVSSALEANKKAKAALEKGAESIWFELPSQEISVETLLDQIDLESVLLYIKTEFLSEEFFNRLRGFLKDKASQVYLQTDIIGKLARTGNWFFNLKEDHRVFDRIHSKSEGISSVVSINTDLYQNAGANIPQQLAYALAHVNEYLNHMGETALSSSIKSKFLPQFLVASGGDYFFEIAKIRALRWLYSTLAREYDLPGDCHILAQPTKRNKTLYDYNVNLLRTTTECMSAVLGGADSVSNSPYDAIYHKNNDFGARMARNQLLILKHEAYLDKVSNAAEGTYYIETLTRQFAEKALEIFKEIEKGGGFLKQLKTGVIQKKIKESAGKEQQQFDKGELVLIGTNKFENIQDKMKDELELFPFLKKNKRKTLLEPILERRLSEKSEQERLAKESAEN
ncbi:methylmalonyl-CoA mutase subunit beta [Salegentibacter sp. F14]